MSCINRKCKIKTNLKPNGLCGDCDKFIGDWNKRKENNERKKSDRADALDQHRDISCSPPGPQAPTQVTDFPDLELTRIVRQWKDMSSGNVQAPEPTVMLKDMYDMMAMTHSVIFLQFAYMNFLLNLNINKTYINDTIHKCHTFLEMGWQMQFIRKHKSDYG